MMGALRGYALASAQANEMSEQQTTPPNLEITDAAGEYLARLLDEGQAGDTVRFVFGLQGLEPQPSAVLPGDTVFEYQGRTVLALDHTMSQMLAGRKLDVEQTQKGPILRLT